MASQQVSREKKSEQGVEKDRVPKMTSHFESLNVKDSGVGNVGRFEMHVEGERDLGKESGRSWEIVGGRGGDADVSQFRQKPNDALRAANERYNKAKEEGAEEKISLNQGAQDTWQIAAEKAARAKESLVQGAQRTSQYVAEKGGVLKDTAVEKGQPLYESSRDTLAGAGKTAADKAVGAKDVVGESGKGTAGYVGSVATNVKDKAVVAGWGAAEYTADKVVGATKAVANVTAGAAGYVGETAVAAKDKVGNVGVSAKDYTVEKLAAAKDAVVATEESAKDYAARKRAEAEREMQAKKAAEAKGEVWRGSTEQKRDDVAGAGRQAAEATKETIKRRPVEKAGEFFQEQQGGGHTTKGGGGVLNAIGETIVEIGQTTKDLLVGKGQTNQSTQIVKDSSESNK